MMAADQIAAARVFYRIINKFFDIIVRLPLDDFTGKRMNVDRLLEKNREKYIGAYGFALCGSRKSRGWFTSYAGTYPRYVGHRRDPELDS